MLEKMEEFFNSRLDDYEKHQLTCIESAREFYPYTARLLPMDPESRVLDLGCGTGLELDYYFRLVPTANVTGVDISSGMLEVLNNKFQDKYLTLIHGSFFDVPFGENAFDASVSVESFHHFSQEEKINLYKKVYKALKPDGYFIITDYFSMSDDEEQFHREEFVRLKNEQNIFDDELYHYDIPLTVDHEKEALLAAGFSSVMVLKKWGATLAIKAIR